MMEQIRRHYLIDGRVQGVGFRYRAKHAADYLGLTGWVRNLPDGSVEMEAQGSPAALARLLPMIEAGTWIEITSFTTKDLPVDEKETSFRVTGY